MDYLSHEFQFERQLRKKVKLAEGDDCSNGRYSP